MPMLKRLRKKHPTRRSRPSRPYFLGTLWRRWWHWFSGWVTLYPMHSLSIFTTITVGTLLYIFAPTLREGFYTSTAQSGFRVREVLVSGRNRVDRQDLLTACGLKLNDSIFRMGPWDVKARLEKISWIERASVQRVLPDQIYITIYERVPVAIWQIQKRFHLVDADGVIIDQPDVSQYPTLPIIVGEQAAQHFKPLQHALSAYPDLQQRISAYIRVGKRRWDLRIDKSLNIQLPEDHLDQALERLKRLQDKQKLDPLKIRSIDLRLTDRIIVRYHGTVGKKTTAAEERSV